MGPMDSKFWSDYRAALSDRPSPRGGGPRELAVQRARELIEIADSGYLDYTSPQVAAQWIGRAREVMRELTRDAEVIAPSGDTTGVTDTAAIQAAVDRLREVPDA